MELFHCCCGPHTGDSGSESATDKVSEDLSGLQTRDEQHDLDEGVEFGRGAFRGRTQRGSEG